MRDGWIIRNLGEIADLQRGLTYSKGDEVPFSSKRVLRSNNIDLDSSKLDLTELKYLREDFAIPEDRKVKKNSIFICMSNGSKQHVGKVAFIDADIDYAFGGFMGLIVPKSGITPKYVFYNCQSSAYRLFLSSIGNGIGITNLRFTDLANYSIPVPSIAEQEKIVAELDCLTGIIEKKKKQLAELDKLAQSIFYDMFGNPIANEKGWEQRTMNELFVFSQGIQVPVEDQSTNKLSGYVRFLRIIDFTQQGEPPRFIKNPGDKYLLKNGEIAIVRYGSPGFVCYGVEEGAIANNLFKVSPKSSSFFHHRFLSFLLKTDVFQRPIKGEQYGATMKAISFKTIGGIVFPIPPRDLQDAFAVKIEAIEKQKELVKRSIVEAETLFNSRMDYWFN